MVTVAHLHLAPGSRLPMRSVPSVTLETAAGIVGDRYHGARHRQVSVQSLEALTEASELFGAPVPPELTRRNVTVSSGIVPREPGALIRLGPVLLEVVRVAAPCKLLDDTIGRGAQEALRRRGGSVCRVLEGGSLSVGDVVDLALPVAARGGRLTLPRGKPLPSPPWPYDDPGRSAWASSRGVPA